MEHQRNCRTSDIPELISPGRRCPYRILSLSRIAEPRSTGIVQPMPYRGLEVMFNFQ
jgi:hypothetical protein